MRSKEEARRLLNSGFMKQMAEAVSHYVAPIFWGHRVSDCTTPEAKVNNGSIFLLNVVVRLSRLLLIMSMPDI